jgi:hypothetical protein
MPFPEDMRGALISREGPKGEMLAAALSFERGEFVPPLDAYASAYVEALAWATNAADELFDAPAVAA